MTAIATAYLSLGGNIEPERNMRAALAALRERFGEVVCSTVYRSPAAGFEGADFLNAAARIRTDLPPQALDDWLHALEAAQGRRRDAARFSSRTLDLDLLLYDNCVLNDAGHLQLPRPELATQAFVLGPMAELAPDLIHPTLRRSLAQLWADCADRDSLIAVDLSCAN